MSNKFPATRELWKRAVIEFWFQCGAVKTTSLAVGRSLPFLMKRTEYRPCAIMGCSAAVALLLLNVHHRSKCYKIIRDAQASHAENIEKSLKDVQASITRLENKGNQAIRAKEEYIRQLQYQNVQQTRSIDRLNLTLRSVKMEKS